MAYDFRNDPLGLMSKFLGPRDAEAPKLESTGSVGKTWPGTGMPYDLVARTIGAQALGEEVAEDEPIEMEAEDARPPAEIEMPAEDVPGRQPPVVVNVDASPDVQNPSGTPPGGWGQVQPQQAPPAPSDQQVAPGAPQTVHETAGQVRDLAVQDRLAAADLKGGLAVEGAMAALPEEVRAYNEKQEIREQAFRAEQAYQMDVMRTRERLRSAVDAVSKTSDPFGGPGGSSRIMAVALAGISSQFGGGGTGDIILKMIEADVAASQTNAKDSVDALTKEMAAIGGMREDVAKSFDTQVGIREKQLADRLGVIAAQMAPGMQQAAAMELRAQILEDYEKRFTELAKEDVDYRLKEEQILETRAKTAKEYALAGKANRSGGSGGIGRVASGAYTVPTPVFDPWTGKQVYANHKPTKDDIKTANDAIDIYRAYKNDLREFEELMKQAGTARSKGGQVWDRWRTTNEARLDRIRGKLVGSFAKVLAGGYNPSQVMEERADTLVPKQKELLSGVDPWPLVDDMNRTADEEFETRMRSRGFDGTNLVNSADSRRLPRDEGEPDLPPPGPGASASEQKAYREQQEKKRREDATAKANAAENERYVRKNGRKILKLSRLPIPENVPPGAGALLDQLSEDVTEYERLEDEPDSPKKFREQRQLAERMDKTRNSAADALLKELPADELFKLADEHGIERKLNLYPTDDVWAAYLRTKLERSTRFQLLKRYVRRR